MDTLFQIFIRLALLIMGALFFLVLLCVGFVLFLLWLIRQLWYKITGKTPEPFSAFQFDPRQGFTYFYSRSTTAENQAPRPSQRTLEDVTDAEIKEVTPPKDKPPRAD